MQRPTFHRMKAANRDPFLKIYLSSNGACQHERHTEANGRDTECWNVENCIAGFGSLSAIFDSLVSKP